MTGIAARHVGYPQGCVFGAGVTHEEVERMSFADVLRCFVLAGPLAHAETTGIECPA